MKPTAEYEFGSNGNLSSYLFARRSLPGREKRETRGQANFKITSTIVELYVSFVLFPLAHLGLARAYALQGDANKARTSYQDFFALWKDADPDIPILKQAKAEYAKLQ